MNAIETTAAPAPSLERFLRETAAHGQPGERFSLESARTLRIDLDGEVWLKPGAALAHRGEVGFARRPTLEADGPLDVFLREYAPLVRASGRGCLYCGHRGQHVRLVQLDDDALVVAWEELLAFEASLAFEPRLVSHGVSLAAGGLVTVRLEGTGTVALLTHGQPLTLAVTPGQPVDTDPHATLAWSDSLDPTLKTDVTWRTLVGHGGHEAFQMHFEGAGFVVVQPSEDPNRLADLGTKPLKKLASMLGI